jgi:hypothetical protein
MAGQRPNSSFIYSLYIINKSGGLIYSKVDSQLIYSSAISTLAEALIFIHGVLILQEFENTVRIDLNDTLRLASIW